MNLIDDIKPIYLGYETTTKTYYFYFIKEGIPRFLVYVTYFHWGKGPQTALALIPVPEEIEIELEEFLSGSLKYEFVKLRKNSKQPSIKKVYRTPQQVEGASSMVEYGQGKPTQIPGIPSTGVPSFRGSNAGTETETPVLKRRRRTKVEMQELKKSLAAPVMDVAVVNSESENVNKKRKYVRRAKES